MISPTLKAALFALLCGIMAFALFVIITMFVAAFQVCVWVWHMIAIGGGPFG